MVEYKEQINTGFLSNDVGDAFGENKSELEKKAFIVSDLGRADVVSDVMQRKGKTKEEKIAYAREYYRKNKVKIAQRRKIYRENNKESISEYAKAYREKHKTTIAGRAKVYRDKNKEAISEYARAWYQKNKDAVSLKTKQYREKNKDKIALKKKEYREKAKLKNSGDGFSSDRSENRNEEARIS